MGPRRMTTQAVVCLIPARAWFQLNDQVAQFWIEESLQRRCRRGNASTKTSEQKEKLAFRVCFYSEKITRWDQYEDVRWAHQPPTFIFVMALFCVCQRSFSVTTHQPEPRWYPQGFFFFLFCRRVGCSLKVGPLHIQFSVTFLPTGNLCWGAVINQSGVLSWPQPLPFEVLCPLQHEEIICCLIQWAISWASRPNDMWEY